jgi:hypothetical protein
MSLKGILKFRKSNNKKKMSLYKNCGRWKHFDCIFVFSAKSYVRNAINLSCAKIVLCSVIVTILWFIFL